MWFLRGLFISLWMAFQIFLPLWMKFGPPPFHYRYARFSWAMYGRPPLLYEIQFFPDLKSVNSGRLQELYLSPRQLQERYAGLIRHVARERADGGTYRVSLRWIRSFEPNLPERWEFEAHAD